MPRHSFWRSNKCSEFWVCGWILRSDWQYAALALAVSACAYASMQLACRSDPFLERSGNSWSVLVHAHVASKRSKLFPNRRRTERQWG